MDPIFGKVFDTNKWMKYGAWFANSIAFILIGVIIGAVISAHQRAARVTANNVAILQSLSPQMTIAHVVPKLAVEVGPPKQTPKSAVISVAPKTMVAVAAPSIHPVIITVRPNDSLPRIFRRIGYKAQDARKILEFNQDTKTFTSLRQGQKILFMLDADKKMRQITYSPDILTTLTITCEKGCRTSVRRNEPKERLEYVSGYLSGSMHAAAKRIGLTRKLTTQLVTAFRAQINLSRLQKGDKIAMFYRSYYVNGKKYRDGDLAAAVVTHKNKNYKIVAFTDPRGKTDFYLADGTGMVPPFMRFPLQFKRISSRFSLSRYHPILHFSRPHLGVDFAANFGTPVHATSDGHISFVGNKSGLGKALELQHNQYRTVYGHLSRFAQNIHPGSYVRKGQLIAYVGSTGLSDGPHLHYEFRINNVPHDPLRVKLPMGEMIASCYRKQFFALSRMLLAQLDMYSRNIAMLN